MTPPEPARNLKFNSRGEIVGEGEPEVSVVIKNAAGEIVGRGVTDSRGNFAVKPSGGLAPNDEYTVTLIDDALNESLPANVIFTGRDENGQVIDVTPPNPPVLSPLGRDGLLKGTGETGTIVKVYDAEGRVVAESIVVNGQFEATVPASSLNGQQLRVTLTDGSDNESGPTEVTTPNLNPEPEPEPKPASPTDIVVDPITGVVTGKTVNNGTVDIKNADGIVIGTAVANAQGVFTFQLPKYVQNGQDLAAEAVTQSGTRSDPTSFKANTFVPDNNSGEDAYGNSIYDSGDYIENRVNTTVGSDQQGANLTALKDGGWIVTWQSYNNGWDVFQQRYDQDGNKRGTETRVNTRITNDQIEPSITALEDGGWIVTWRSWNQNGSSSGWDIVQQRYDTSGAKVGREITVNQRLTYDQTEAQVAALPDGGWIVVWKSDDANDDGIFQQRFNSDGNPVFESQRPGFWGEQQVNSSVYGTQSQPNVTALADGGWVVTWTTSDGANGTAEIMQQRYDRDGQRVGYEAQVNTTTKGNQGSSTVHALSDGGWIVAWDSAEFGTSNRVINTQRYDANGNKYGAEKRLPGSVADEIRPSITGLADGGYVVTWVSSDADGSATGIKLLQFDRLGRQVGEEKIVNTGSDSEQKLQKVTALDDGGYVVAWEGWVEDGTRWNVYQQRFDSNGARWEPTVNTTYSGDQTQSATAYLAGGGYVVTWTSAGQDGNGRGIVHQRFDQDGNKVGVEQIVNRVTQGDQENSTVVGLPDGGYLIVWQGRSSDDTTDIYAARYDKNGVRVNYNGSGVSDASAGDTIINTAVTRGDQLDPSVVALSDGGWVITWSGPYVKGVNNASIGAVYQVYDATGQAVGPQQLVTTTYQTGAQVNPSVAALSNGGFVITWRTTDGSDFGDTSNGAIIQQRFFADGRPDGKETRVNTLTDGYQEDPKVTSLGESGYVIAWFGKYNGQNREVKFQRFTNSGEPVGQETTANDVNSTNYARQLSITTLPNGDFFAAS